MSILDLNTNKEKKDTKVLVAMSGGVDSSVVAAILKDEGYQVIGVTLQLYNNASQGNGGRTCCGTKDIHDARKVAAQLEIPHYVIDYESVFKKEVIERFADDYLAGVTPIPCVRCNQSVKFRDLLKVAKDINADAMATGHYVRRINQDGVATLHIAADPTKDQSYFLFSTTQDQLDYLHFPLGSKTKSEVRQIAHKYNLSVSDKKDSQDICFVPNGDYASVVANLRPDSSKPGDIIYMSTGKKVGTHDGLINYTIGQRRGIGASHPKPLYVIFMDQGENVLYVGEEEELYRFEFTIEELNLLDNIPNEDGIMEAMVCLRALQPLLPAKITVNTDGKTANVRLYQKGRAITKGQACVIYEGTRVLGGGIINEILG